MPAQCLLRTVSGVVDGSGSWAPCCVKRPKRKEKQQRRRTPSGATGWSRIVEKLAPRPLLHVTASAPAATLWASVPVPAMESAGGSASIAVCEAAEWAKEHSSRSWQETRWQAHNPIHVNQTFPAAARRLDA
jgi:hypothetical protein